MIPISWDIPFSSFWTKTEKMVDEWFFSKIEISKTVLSQGVLSVGSLLELQLPPPHNKFYFLATAMKKPRLHVLIRGFPGVAPTGETTVSILDPATSLPEILLSHQMFQAVLAFKTVDAIEFILHEYEVQPFLPLHTVKLAGNKEHKMSIAGAHGPKKQTRLPFRLIQSPRKKRKPKAKANQPKTRAKPPQRDPDLHAPVDLDGIDRELAVLAANEPEESGSESSASSSSRGSSTSSISSSSSSSSSFSDAVEQPLLTAEAKQEEKEIQAALKSHESLMESRGLGVQEKGLDSEPEAKREVPTIPEGSQPQDTKVPLVPKPKEKSFCNKIIGLVDCGTQVSKKLATCRECNLKIQWNGVRFAYAASRTKWEGWLHAKCTVQHMVSKRADWQQALDFLEKRKEKQPALKPEVLAEIESLEAECREHLASMERACWNASSSRRVWKPAIEWGTVPRAHRVMSHSVSCRGVQLMSTGSWTIHEAIKSQKGGLTDQ